MKLIIGLGNPGEEYQGARHNVGFMAIDAIAKQSGADFEMDKKLKAEVAKTKLGGKAAVLAKPQTFVNKSGEAAKKLKTFAKAKNGDIVIVHDDLDIEFGNFKLSFAKDSAGHRGVQSIIDTLKSNKFWRLRIGTANRKLAAARRQKTPQQKKEAVAAFVLSKFTPAEQTELKEIIKKALERVEGI